jgi:hypothetical protein
MLAVLDDDDLKLFYE